jgi:hypothetical protein
MQAQKDSRATTSCTECQRRKQKASNPAALFVYRLADEKHSALANGRVIIARLGKWLICVNLLSKSSRLNLKSIIRGMWKTLNNKTFLIQSTPRQNHAEKKGQKRSCPTSSEEAIALPQTGEFGQSNDGLRAWGYMPGHVHWKVGAIDNVRPSRACVASHY